MPRSSAIQVLRRAVRGTARTLAREHAHHHTVASAVAEGPGRLRRGCRPEALSAWVATPLWRARRAAGPRRASRRKSDGDDARVQPRLRAWQYLRRAGARSASRAGQRVVRATYHGVLTIRGVCRARVNIRKRRLVISLTGFAGAGERGSRSAHSAAASCCAAQARLGCFVALWSRVDAGRSPPYGQSNTHIRA